MEYNSITQEDTSRAPNSERIDKSMIGQPTLVQWYIDTRRWEDKGFDLPLIQTLTQSDQEAVKKYFHTSDKRMSLASQLLKYYFVHQATGASWDEIEIQRTPVPERRPFYDSSVDFNVSHQAGITMLTGTRAGKSATSGFENQSLPRVGVDIACVDEPSRRRNDRPPKTLADLATFVDVFTEVLSPSELNTIKNPLRTVQLARHHGLAGMDLNDNNEEHLARYGVRLFYSIWALKEAYLKMTGDGLIASWIKELEFSNVIPPSPAPQRRFNMSLSGLDEPDHAAQSAFTIAPSVQNWGPPYTDIKITLKGESVHHVRVQLVAFEDDYIVATAASGSNVGAASKEIVNKGDHHLPGYINLLDPVYGSKDIRIAPTASRDIGDRDPWRVHSAISDPWLPMQEVDIDVDIRPCAEGRCSHLQNPHSIFAYVHS
jgi:4'-phosphopantetheinyl transferase